MQPPMHGTPSSSRPHNVAVIAATVALVSLGVLGLVFSLAGPVYAQKQGPEFGPLWYSIAIVLISLPCAWLGGRIRRAQLAEGREA